MSGLLLQVVTAQVLWVELLHLEGLHLMVLAPRWVDLVTVVALLWGEWEDHLHLVDHLMAQAARLMAQAQLMAQAPHWVEHHRMVLVH